MRYVGLLVTLFLLACMLIGCDSIEDGSTLVAPELAPAAPERPVGWVAQNLRIKSYVTTADHIVVWLTFERDGTQTVSKKVYIPKGD